MQVTSLFNEVPHLCYQASAFCPLFFFVAMDAITEDLRKAGPSALLYADDVMPASSDPECLGGYQELQAEQRLAKQFQLA